MDLLRDDQRRHRQYEPAEHHAQGSRVHGRGQPCAEQGTGRDKATAYDKDLSPAGHKVALERSTKAKKKKAYRAV